MREETDGSVGNRLKSRQMALKPMNAEIEAASAVSLSKAVCPMQTAKCLNLRNLRELY